MGRRWLLLVLLFTLPANVNASQADTKQVWNDIAASVLEFGKQEQFDRSKMMLEKFATVFPGDQSSELSTTELRVVLNTHDRALKAVTSMDEANDQRLQALTEFRLAVDALVTEKQPIWQQTDDQILPLINEMATAIEHGDVDVYNASKDRFLGSYSVIRPALAIDLSKETQQRLDSHIAFIESYASERNSELAGQLQTMYDDFEQAYHPSPFEESSLIWLIISIGGTIILTLLYVIYRKYKGEKEAVRKKLVE
ncbi:sporulation protein YpjB [Bacillus sp. RAR_GA_16]|uniref:sporulation protein YpjB n=1 Tax=Bacillus sp. RAR_GA_16 TaxID=2876774 RepID=UPI001CCD1A48|nr:sporulation protein YpjB [Bacillus sp. RAR_GA_16]MCA0172062.1 sporulation protein YpjB [Bacillus sp. RAR_GA_16]